MIKKKQLKYTWSKRNNIICSCFKEIFYYIRDITYIVSGGEAMRLSKNVMQEIVGAFPGIDEAMSYAEVMK